MVRSATFVRASAAVVGLLLLLAGCGSDHISGGACDSISIDPPSATMFIGDTLRLHGTTTLRNQDGGCDVSAATPLNWSTDSDFVEITSGADGVAFVVIAAMQPGVATIHATSTQTTAVGTSQITVREH